MPGVVPGNENPSAVAAQNAAAATGGVVGNATNPATSTQGTASVIPPNPLSDLGSFVTKLSSPHLWLRVAEVVVGVMFLAIGLNAILKNPVGKVAAAAPKVVPI